MNDGTPIWKRHGEGQAIIRVHLVSENHPRLDLTHWCKQFDFIDLFLYEDQPLIFVEVGEFAQVLRPAPNVVRLKSLEQCYAFIPYAFQIGMPPTGEALRVVFDRELNSMAGRARILFGEGASHVVQRVSETIGALANSDSYAYGDAIKGLLKGFSIGLMGENTIIGMSNEIFQPSEVFSTPIYHGVDFIEFLEHGAPNPKEEHARWIGNRGNAEAH